MGLGSDRCFALAAFVIRMGYCAPFFGVRNLTWSSAYAADFQHFLVLDFHLHAG